MDCYKCGYGISAYYGSLYGKKCPNCASISPTSRTQKGKGIFALYEQYGGNTLSVSYIVQSIEQLPKYGYPFFARPAPSLPRHGYIDSRIVKNLAELTALLTEVLADDPGGEILLCKKIDASFNMVWTPTSLAVGQGHDGATAGTDQTMIPLAYSSSPILSSVIKAAEITDYPFIEAVTSHDGVILTQLRNGPKTPGNLSGDYIPQETVVEEIIIADPEEYKDRGWEIRIEQSIGKSGVVVWHPNGTITDHFSIHAFNAGFPIIFGKECPSLGQVLHVTSEKLSYDPKAMLRGVAAGETIKLGDGNWSNAVKMILLALHNSPAMTGEHSRWIGMAAALMIRTGCTALRGEARHFRDSSSSAKKSRETVYNEHINRKLTFHQASVNRLINIFRYGRWQSAGFGGLKWAACGASTVALFNAIRELAVNQTEESASKVVMALNLAVNQAHNGGWWLNKYCDNAAFKNFMEGELISVISVGPIAYSLDKAYKAHTEESAKLRTTRLTKWSNLTLSPPKTTGAKITVSSTDGKVSIAISARLLGKQFRPIAATIQGIDAKAAGENKTIYLVEGQDGYRLEKRTEDVCSVLWQEDPLMDKAIKMKVD